MGSAAVAIMARKVVRAPDERHCLRADAANTRLRAIQQQLSVGFTFCAVAETAILLGQPGCALRAIRQVRHTAEAVSCHLLEPHHLPAASLPDVRHQLAQLESRILGVEAQLAR